MNQELFRRRVLLVAGLGAVSLWLGCTAPQATGPVPEGAQKALRETRSRSLSDPGLCAFITGIETSRGSENQAVTEPSRIKDLSSLCNGGASNAHPGLTPYDVLLASLYFNLQLRIAEAQQRTVEAAEVTAAQRPNPLVTTGGGYKSSLGSGVVPWVLGAAFDLVLELNGKRSLRMQEAEFRSESARWKTQRTLWQLRSTVYGAIADGEINQQAAAISRELAQQLQRLLELTKVRVQQGYTGRPEELAAERTATQGRADAAEREHQSLQSANALRAIIGLPNNTPMLLAKERLGPLAAVAVPASEVLRIHALQRRSDVRGALADYAAADRVLQGQEARRIPNIHLLPSYQWSQSKNQWQMQFSEELLLFNRNEGPIAEAAAAVLAARTHVEAAEATVEADVGKTYTEVLAAQESYRYAEQLVAMQRERLKELRLSLTLGDADRVAVAQGEVDSFKSELSCLESRRRLLHALIALEGVTESSFLGLD